MQRRRADDLFGMPNGTSITDRVIEANIQWAERMMQRMTAFIPSDVDKNIVQRISAKSNLLA